jgi:hypothetical protein
LRFSNLFGNRFAISPQACNVHLDGFHCPRAAFLDGAAGREAPGSVGTVT